MARKVMDCRRFPSESKCSLTIAGEEEEVLRASVMHAVDVHGETDTPKLREELRQLLTEETPGPAPSVSPTEEARAH